MFSGLNWDTFTYNFWTSFNGWMSAMIGTSGNQYEQFMGWLLPFAATILGINFAGMLIDAANKAMEMNTNGSSEISTSAQGAPQGGYLANGVAIKNGVAVSVSPEYWSKRGFDAGQAALISQAPGVGGLVEAGWTPSISADNQRADWTPPGGWSAWEAAHGLTDTEGQKPYDPDEYQGA